MDTETFWAKAMALTESKMMRWSTMATYWAAMRAGKKYLDLPPAQTDILMTRRLEHKAQEEAALTPRAAITPEQMRLLIQHLSHTAAVMATLTFILGQRLGDIAKLHTEALQLVQLPGQHTLAIPFLEGKVIPKTGSYCLHLAASNPVVHDLIKLQQSMSEHKYLFPEDCQDEIASTIQVFHTDTVKYDVRALRRGGLQEMARMGLSLDELRVFSRHPSDSMLLRYLQGGICLAHQAGLTTGTADAMIDAIRRH